MRIAKTPHFVGIITYSAMNQHLNVHKGALVAGNGDTVCNLVANLAITQNGAGGTIQ